MKPYLQTVGTLVLGIGLLMGFDSHASDLSTCQTLPGFDAVLESPAPIIWFGEGHGTNEAPALFANAVCKTSASGQPVVVALERFPSEQKDLDEYMRSDGSPAARAKLLASKSGGWSYWPPAGTSSAAMLALVDRLRELEKSGKILGVFAIDEYQGESLSNQWMAGAVDRLRIRFPESRILVFTGDHHASKLPAKSDDKAASLLEPADVISIDIIGAPASMAWNRIGGETGVHPGGGIDHAPGFVGVEPGAPWQLKERGFDYVAYLGVPTTVSEPALAEAFALTAPVGDAFAKVEDEQSKLTPARDDRERLERMLDLDQAGREQLSNLNFAALPQEQQLAAQDLVWNDINTRDMSNQKALKAMMPAKGWFGKSKYGNKASTAAFLIVQHAVNDPDLMRTALKRMEPLVKTGEVDGEDYGLLYDRVSLDFDHRPQRYGSQVECKDGKWQPRSLEDPAHVDERRKALGFHMTEEAYLQHFAGKVCQ